MVRCAKCAHTWHEPHPDAELETAAAPPSVESAIAERAEANAQVEPAEPEPRPQAFSPEQEKEKEQEDEAHANVPSFATPEHTPEPDELPARAPAIARESAARHAAAIAGWTVLVLLILVIGWSAVHYRRDVATYWPQSASLYSALGLEVNVRGIAFDGVTYHRGLEDGSPVLTVTGQLVNISSRELPVPQIRIALTDKDKRELFAWTYVPNILTLKPGQVAPFRTRLASPPDGARHLELRFVKAGE
jgi:hypothetical protein